VTPWPLPTAFPPTLGGCVLAILAFDTISAVVTRRFQAIKYSSLWPLQFACYVTFGFVAMFELLDVRLAAAIGAITGLVEATLGWAITWRMGPGRQARASAGSIAVAVGSMIAFGFGLALLGALALDAIVVVTLRTRG
jgi:hypothetical protein